MRNTGKFFSTILSALALATALSSCSVRRSNSETQSSAITKLSCTATPSKQQVGHLENFSVRINAMGGVPPYMIPGVVSTFASFTDLSKAFDNSGTGDKLVNDPVTILDSEGNGAYCNYVVSVRSISSTANNSLSCAINAMPAAPDVNQDVVFTLQGSGGSSYNFLYFYPDSSQAVNLNALANGNATATFKYTSAGARNAFAVMSSGGQLAVCSKQVPVGAATVSLAATPSTTVSVGQTLTLSATPAGFAPDATPVYTYTALEAGVSVTQPQPGSSTATVSVTDNQPHASVNVTVTAAAANGQSASKTIQVTFAQSLSCTVTAPARIVANRPVNIGVTAETGEEMRIEEFQGAEFYNGLGTNTVIALFSDAGPKTIKLKARSTSRAVYCHNGTFSEMPVTVVRPLNSCSVQTDANPSVFNNTTRVNAIIPADAGLGPFRIQLTSNGSYTETSPASGTQVGIRFNEPGTWNLNVTVTDTSDGITASCSTTQTINSISGLEARVFSSNLNSPVTNSWDNVQSYQKFVAANINVPARDWNLGFPGVNNLLENFVINFRGKINLPLAGTYRFRTVSDDGVILFIDNNPLINNPYLHGPSTDYSNNIALTAGNHDIKIVYAQGPRYYLALTLEWLPPGQSIWMIVPPEAFTQPTTPMP
ncbi:hypothetical protein K2X33_06690 [bacterium]|nr:hypothetical protein [bacterium]